MQSEWEAEDLDPSRRVSLQIIRDLDEIIRTHVYEYTEQIFASNLSHRDRKPKYLSKF